MSNLAKRKSYAADCLINGRSGTRAYDNCFENGDGDEVVKHLMKRALSANDADINSTYNFGVTYTIGGKEWRALQSKRNNIRLRDGIKDAGTWDYWLYFYNNGTYAGFKKTA